MRRLTFALLFSFALASPTWAATYCWNPLSTGHAWTDSVWSATTCNPAVAGTSGPPTASDTAIFSSLDTSPVTISSAAVALNVSFTDTLGYTGTVSGTSTLAISGSLTLSSGVVWNYTGAITFNATSTGQTITTAGIAFNNNVTFNGTGGGWTNQDFWANRATITLTAGTWSTNNKTITTGFLSITGSTTCTATFTNSTFILTGASGTIWNISGTGLTFSATGSKLLIDGVGTGATRTFAGAGLTYNNFEWANENTTSTLIITGANTFADFKVDASSLARTLNLPASTTQTMTTMELKGSSGQLLSVISSSSGTQATISVASGTVICDYCSIQDSAATGGALFYAVQSTNVSNNTGWTFGDVPGTGGLSNMLLLGVGQ